MKKIFTLFTMAVMAIATASAGVVRTTLIKTDFSNNQAIGGWGGTIAAADGVCTLTHVGTGDYYVAQACVDASPAIPAETKVTVVIKAKASAAYSLAIGLQMSDGYVGRGDFETIPLTTDFQTFTRTCTTTGEGTDRVLLNFGNFDGTITIDELEVYYEEESAADDYMLKVTTSAKANPWDSQVLINIPEALKTGVNYEIKFFVKGSVASSEELGSIIENNSVGADKRDGNNNSTELQYPATFPVTTSWAEVSIGESNGEYAYDRLLLNIGKFDGTLYFDNFRFINKTDNSEIVVDFKDGISGKAEKRSWHSHVSIERAASDCPTDVKVETEATKQNGLMYSISGYQVGKSAKGIVIMNGKKYSKK